MRLSKKKQSILDCFTYDLRTFFYDDYQEINSEETAGTFMIVYEKYLPWKELNTFDNVQFRIFFDKESLTETNPINVKFISRNTKPSLIDTKNIVGKIISIYGDDDSGKSDWSNKDEQAFIKKDYRRVWSIEKGESFICIEYNEKLGITLSILFFNKLLINNTIDSDN